MAVDLTRQLEGQSPQILRQVAAEAALMALTRIPLADPRLDAAISAIRKGALGNAAERHEVRGLVKELDQIAWDTQDKAEQGILPLQAYLDAFAQARAVAAVGFALEPDAQYAALESVYEAWAATADIDAVRTTVRTVIHRSS